MGLVGLAISGVVWVISLARWAICKFEGVGSATPQLQLVWCQIHGNGDEHRYRELHPISHLITHLKG